MTSIAAPVSDFGADLSFAPRAAVLRAAIRIRDAIAAARMERALALFSDAALAKLGVARADIPAHAARLAGLRRG